MTDIPKKKRKSSIDPFGSSVTPSSYIDVSGRSYVSMSHRPSMYNLMSPTVNQGQDIHADSANLASNWDKDNSESSVDDDEHESLLAAGETTPLVLDSTPRYGSRPGSPEVSSEWNSPFGDLESGHSSKAAYDVAEPSTAPKSLMSRVTQPLSYLPAVFLGTLLNILDGLSYGMIMFPISEAVFSALAPAGLSMFYMSTIVSQLIYSLGGSAFSSGIGSEMIEVTPFFHTMALAIAAEMSDASNDAIIATTITSYAVSSIVTGIVFWGLGKCRLGRLVGFFPRHILVGCIGGVGYFLIATGIEVSSRLEGGLVYNGDTLHYLFSSTIVILEWTVPLALAAVLVLLERRVHSSLVVPGFFIGVFILFHVLVAAVPGWDLESARRYGWVFPKVDSSTPWYQFYSLYKLQLVDWFQVVRQFPTMLALTFFGILHVPINVPALAVTVGMDEFDVDRELVAHGYSNALSGMVGSIQNYLVYTNSVMFIRAGADSRVAGVMLAVATAAVMMVGPGIIGFIPVCVVGALIYLLGYELLKEALYDTWGRLRPIEYFTIVLIVVTMGAVDFVIGILVGILMACLSFVVEAARRPVVQSVYSGTVARSTVLRHTAQQEFLNSVASQICVVKLQGTLFFGSIGGVEQAIRQRFDPDNFARDPIKFLIFDMKGVGSIDFSAAEGFRRLFNLANQHHTQLIFSSVHEQDDIIKAMRDAGIFDISGDYPIELFGSLNYALEWCENRFLHLYKQLKRKGPSGPKRMGSGARGSLLTSTSGSMPASYNRKSRYSLSVGTPRTTQLYQAASKTARDENTIHNRYYNQSGGGEAFNQQPLPLIMISFLGLSDQDEKFWSGATKYFVKEHIPQGVQFYSTSDSNPAFFLVESGIVRSIMKLFDEEGEYDETKEVHSSILANTAFGDIFDPAQFREITYEAASEQVVCWKITHAKLKEMQVQDKAVFRELLIIQNKLTKERFDTLTGTLIITG
ncbi:vacuolar basic amino acid transporter Vsb1p [Diutina catenulata]